LVFECSCDLRNPKGRDRNFSKWVVCIYRVLKRKQNLFVVGHAANGAFENFSKSTIGLYRPV
jgi:hypothetical protein